MYIVGAKKGSPLLRGLPVGVGLFRRGCFQLAVMEKLRDKRDADEQQPDEVADRTGINKEDPTGQQHDAHEPRNGSIGVSGHAHGDARHADDRGDHNADKRPDTLHINKQQAGIEGEDVRNNECADGKLGGSHTGFERIGMGDGAACIGGKRYRRGNICHDAEVEYEHVRR